jgi:hypothetical protein
MDMKKTDEFLSYLKIATDRNPKEAKTVLGCYFPEDMAPQDYYEYMSDLINTKK